MRETKDRLADALTGIVRALSDMADKAAAGQYHRSLSPLARQLEIANDLSERIAEVEALRDRARNGGFDPLHNLVKPKKKKAPSP